MRGGRAHTDPAAGRGGRRAVPAQPRARAAGGGARKAPRLRRAGSGGGFVVHAVLLAVLLVVATAIAVAGVLTLALERQIEQAADTRLANGAMIMRNRLDHTRADLEAAGAWLVSDAGFVTAARERRWGPVEAQLNRAVQLRAVDDALVADAGGRIMALAEFPTLAGRDRTVPRDAALRGALAGHTVYAIARDARGLLQQQVSVPLRARSGTHVVGVLRLASFLTQAGLSRFHRLAGLDVSLFFGAQRLLTTLRQSNGAPLMAVGADPAALREVLGFGRPRYVWRDLPIGHMRSYYVPLVGLGEGATGMLSVTLPFTALQDQLRAALVAVLPVVLAVVTLGALGAYVLVSQLRAPILALAQAAGRLRDGDLATPIPRVTEAEFVPLAAELERARQSVQASLEAVTRAEARQRTLLAALREPVLTTSPAGRITSCNPAAAALFGGYGDVQGQSIGLLLPFVAAVQEAQEAQEATWLGQVVSAAGQTVDLEVHRTRLAAGHLPAADVYVVHDVSHHVEVNRSREQLLYTVAHELRAPLTVLHNALEILDAEDGGLRADEVAHLLGAARRTTTRLRVLMDDLLSAGTIQAGRLAIHPQPVPVTEIMDDALEVVTAVAGARGQRVAARRAAPGLLALADRVAARQALVNLVDNATKYGADHGLIQIDVERIGGEVRFTVADDGPAIPADQHAGLFERFYRAPSSQAPRGTGLGLAIVKGIAEAHGGHVGLESTVERGTKVWFTLPVAQDPP